MATVIRLQRGGRKKRPFYSIVVLDSRKRRDGAFIEKLGYFDPCTNPEVINIDRERAQHWIDLGAQPSDRVARLLKASEEGSSVQAKAERKAARAEARKAEAAAASTDEASEDAA